MSLSIDRTPNRPFLRNNNVLVFGGLGSRKISGYIIPNILQCNTSYVLVDQMDHIHKKTAETLVNNGYRIIKISAHNNDAEHLNILKLLKNEAYIANFCRSLVENSVAASRTGDGFWAKTMQFALEAFVEVVWQTNPNGTLKDVYELIASKDYSIFQAFSDDSSIVKHWKTFEQAAGNVKDRVLDEMITDFIYLKHDSGFINTDNNTGLHKDCRELLSGKIALFIETDYTDKSMGPLVSAFLELLLASTIVAAQGNYNKTLVHFFLNDLTHPVVGLNDILQITPFKPIAVSVVTSSIKNLDGCFTKTLDENCDSLVYMGAEDYDTVDYVAKRTQDRFEHDDIAYPSPLEVIVAVRGYPAYRCQKAMNFGRLVS